MNPHSLPPVRMAIALTVVSALVSGCSSSSDSQSLAATVASGSEQSNTFDNSNDVTGSEGLNDSSDDSSTEGSTDSGSNESGSGEGSGITTGNTDTELSDPADSGTDTDTDTNTNTNVDTDNSVPDPLTPNSTQVFFDIEVPAYQSNNLKIGLVWGDIDLTAGWVGDEFWSVSADFPTDTQQTLTVTFFDDNGNITLGSYEQLFRTGTNASESLVISSAQFDTDKWDSDRDGVSNLDELIAGTEPFEQPRILLFSETQDFRHESTETALDALEALATDNGFEVDLAADSAGVFTDDNLAQYDAVVWVMTSGDVLDEQEQTSFESYIRGNGGYAGIHAASFTEYEWPWYGALVGAYFKSHPVIQTATQNVEDDSHSSTTHLGTTWTRTDEWYDYTSNPRAQVNVLLSLDEGSYTGGAMGDDHPSAWYHEYDGGRSWYTGGGHTDESYSEANFLTHLLGGLRYAAGLDD